MQFQSTLPLRGATRSKARYIVRADKFQSTLPLRGATYGAGFAVMVLHISIHTPLAGSDLCGMPIDYAAEKFQSTLPLRGATFTPTSPLITVS